MRVGELDADSAKYNTKVQPHMRRETRGTTYEDKFTFEKVSVEYIDSMEFCTGATHRLTPTHNGSVALFYRYRNEAPVMIVEDGAYKHDEWSVDESEEQAYFALSQLDEKGFVKYWRKA